MHHMHHMHDIARISNTILLVDDDPKLLEAHARWLRRVFPHSYVIARSNSRGAIGVMRCINVDLVVSDFDLGPPENGDAILEWVRVERPALVDRFVFLTGNDNVRHRHVLIKGDSPAAAAAHLTSVLLAATV